MRSSVLKDNPFAYVLLLWPDKTLYSSPPVNLDNGSEVSWLLRLL